MKQKKIKIGLVSYLNTLPFVHGIKMMRKNQTKWDIETSYAYPSKCTTLFLQNKIDIGIIPVGALPQLQNYSIVSNFCLGAQQTVDSVLLLSQKPIKEIESILLDYQSNTSVLMTKVLSRHFWKINPIWIEAEKDFENKINGTTAGVVIGDRTFTLKNQFPFVYDLAAEWYSFQKLPFVFALWIAKPNLPNQFIDDFNFFLNEGVQQLTKGLDLFFDDYHLPISQSIALDYLTKKMYYRYTPDMQKSKDKFLSLLRE